jgi:hypothetical protein
MTYENASPGTCAHAAYVGVCVCDCVCVCVCVWDMCVCVGYVQSLDNDLL